LEETEKIEVYEEIDEENPYEVTYDLDNNEVIISNDDDSVITPSTKKVISRNVGNIKRRRFR
jgi:hypothetical protein